MSTASAQSPETLADVVRRLGGLSLRRIRLRPPPGTATRKDVVKILDRENRPCELVDGLLVEKVMGVPESALACELIRILGTFVDDNNLGFLTGEGGTLAILPHLVLIPDLSFISWDRTAKRQRPTEAIPDLVPDLAVEVLSKGNTKKEMERKLKEYFLAGTRLVWFVEPRRRTVQVFTSPDESRLLTEEDTLDGGDVLPGLVLPVRQVFAKVPPYPAKSARHKAKKSRPGKRQAD
jgi:Uma2 family endonuclease